MYLARLTLDRSRLALTWAANPYRVHQRLAMAFATHEPRLLFRLESTPEGWRILVQSQRRPEWDRAFASLKVLARPPETKPLKLHLEPGRRYRFRLLANPVVKRNGKRLGLLQEERQRAWLARKVADAGAELIGCIVSSQGHVRSRRNPEKDAAVQTHFSVLFEGVLRVHDPARLLNAVQRGVGPGKGYGFGLLSLAPAPA